MPNLIVNGTLYPSVTDEPTHKDIWGYGGYRTVADLTSMSAIPSEHRENGMAVHVRSTGITYMLEGGSWEANGFIADGSIATIKLAPLSVDSTILASNSVTNSKMADESVTNSKMADGAAVTIGTVSSIFDGNTPLVPTGLVLSAETGTTSPCLVFLTVKKWDAGASYIAFGPSGDIDQGAGTIGQSSAYFNSTGKVMISTFTADNGAIEWYSTAAVSATIDLVGYIR